MIDWQSINFKAFDSALNLASIEPVAGGDICQSFKVEDISGASFFVKHHANVDLLNAEFYNLKELEQAPVRTPYAIRCVELDGAAVLVIEFLPLQEGGDDGLLGAALAQSHRLMSADGCYGLAWDNYIGHTPQHNNKHSNWAAFWWEQRLLPQLNLAKRGLSVDVESLHACCQELLKDHHPPASLLHGDLWGGNKGFLADGEPVLFDPACYYGDREADVAFTHVFGGFGPSFYQSYADSWALPNGHEQRRPLYNLYHLLNHYNLFGSGYAASVQQLLNELGV